MENLSLLSASELKRRRSNLDQLPHYCAVFHHVDQITVLITKGESGYHMAPTLDLERFNNEQGANKAHQRAMLAGSLFGWHTPSADASGYDPVTGLAADHMRKQVTA